MKTKVILMPPAVTGMLVLVIQAWLFRPAWAGEPPDQGRVIFDMDSVVHRPGEVVQDQRKIPTGTVSLVEGEVGRAVQFSFTGGVGAGFMTAPVKATPAWDQAAGFSFYIKGDGSTNWGGLELIDRDNYSLRYGYCFPLDSREWRRIVVPWRDVIPELSGPLVDVTRGYAPSHFGNWWFGQWFYWRDFPAHQYAIDQVVLEKSITSEPLTAVSPGLQRFKSRLERHQPVTLVTMGDSLSDKRHWANRDLLWSELLARQIKAQFGSEVSLINPAIGGTTLSQNLVLMPRWLQVASQPDLVIVWFGFNDWDNGIRGERFKEYLALAVERIRRLTHGHADILLLTTCPSFERWDTMKELEQSVREIAVEAKTGLADIASRVRQFGNAEEALKQGCWAWDKTHLGPRGHELAAETVLKAIQSEKPQAQSSE